MAATLVPQDVIAALRRLSWLRGSLDPVQLRAIAGRQLQRYASLDLVSRPDGSLLVPVTIQGTCALMALETATVFSSISENAISSPGLRTQNMPFGTVHGCDQETI